MFDRSHYLFGSGNLLSVPKRPVTTRADGKSSKRIAQTSTDCHSVEVIYGQDGNSLGSHANEKIRFRYSFINAYIRATTRPQRALFESHSIKINQAPTSSFERQPQTRRQTRFLRHATE